MTLFFVGGPSANICTAVLVTASLREAALELKDNVSMLTC